MRLADKRTGYALCRARLAQRRLVVLRTLQYIDSERNNLETIHATRIPPALRKRRALLDKVHGWYAAELKRIDLVLLHLNDLSVTLGAGFAVLLCLELLKPLWRQQLKS